MSAANKGEWSELYALGYVLFHGGGFAADENANEDRSIFYTVLQVVDNPTGTSESIYTISKLEILISKNGLPDMKITREQLQPKLLEFFEELKNKSGSRAFKLESGEVLKKLLAKDRQSATSKLVGDLQFVLEDLESKLPTPKRSFSIKSEVGSPATIFNASKSTNVTFKINTKIDLKPFNDISPVKSNLKDLINLGCSFTFLNYDNPNLHKSLENIDSNLPDYLAEALLGYYLSNTTNLTKICNETWNDRDYKRELKIGKIKKFLSAASMGLRANQVWSGYPEDFGGLLLVKNSGEVLFYYLYNLQKFENYLFNNLRFETPSATRHSFGQIYEEENDLKIKLNLQIRF